MPLVQCSYCGLPFKVARVEPGRPVYCCSGCALASRLPAAGAGGQFPVTADLVVALLIGFAFFNELLFWLLGAALAREGRLAPALVFARISVGLGGLVWAALAAGIIRAPVRRWGDAAVALATLAAVAAALAPPMSAGKLAVANALLALWLGRGWGKRKFTRK